MDDVKDMSSEAITQQPVAPNNTDTEQSATKVHHKAVIIEDATACETCDNKTCTGYAEEAQEAAEEAAADKVIDSLERMQHSSCDHCEVRSNHHAFNWLKDIPGGFNESEMVEVEFKHTRKGFYRNTNHLDLHIGDMVAVEANPGHDIGRVSMTGKLVALQIKKANLRPDVEFLRIFRKAKPSDLERYEAAKAKENDTMIRSRKIAESLNLNMKIGDVEYQGDGNKAIFYYIADERVDFRQLIKVLAENFHVRIEMKQIGARQEAGRIGGIGPCGRPLCCSSWMNNFVSVSTNAARYQDISLNPQKLAGQCAKLKCCLNFEIDAYVESSKKMPPRDIQLHTKDNTYYHFKTDVFKHEVTYSTDKNVAANLVTLHASRIFEVIEMNKQGIQPDDLLPEGYSKEKKQKDYSDIIDQNSLTRFDKVNKKQKNKGNAKNSDNSRQQQNKQQKNANHHHDKQNNGNGGKNRNRRRERNNSDRPKDNATTQENKNQ